MGNALAGPMMAQLMQRLAGAQAARGAPGMAVGAPPEAGPGPAVAQQMSELRGADPQAGLQKIQEMISTLSVLINQYALRIPGAAQSGARALAPLQRMLKEIQNAAQTMQAVGGPIESSAAPSPAMMGGAAPSPGAMGPPQGPAFPT